MAATNSGKSNLKKAEETGPEPAELNTENAAIGAPDESNLDRDEEAGTGKLKKKKKNRKKKYKKRNIQHHDTVASTSEVSSTNPTNVSSAAPASGCASRDLMFISTGNNAIPIIIDTPSTIYAGANATIHAGAGATVHLGYGALLGEVTNVDLFTEAAFANPPDYESNTSPSPHVEATDREATPTPSRSAEAPKHNVKIHYGLEWTDTKGSFQGPRHTPVEELKEIPPVESIKEAWAPEAPVRVSPAKSAASDTLVTVEGSYQELLQRMKDEIFEELEHKFDAKVERKVHLLLARAYAPERRAFGLMLRRNLEEFVLSKMRANIPEAEGESYATFIRRFRSRYRIDEFSDDDFDDLLRSSPGGK